jgi:hypothetical protein
MAGYGIFRREPECEGSAVGNWAVPPTECRDESGWPAASNQVEKGRGSINGCTAFPAVQINELVTMRLPSLSAMCSDDAPRPVG